MWVSVCVCVYWVYVYVFGVSAGCASACWLWSNVHNIFSSASMQLNMHCLLIHTQTHAHAHTHTHAHSDTTAHTLTQISSHVRTRLVAFALLDFHLCHHIARISLCTFWGQIVLLSFLIPRMEVMVSGYYSVYTYFHLPTLGRKKKIKQEAGVSAEGSILLWFIQIAVF